RDRYRAQTVLGGPPMCADVIGQLAMPVSEHRPQRLCGYRGGDAVGHPRALGADLVEFVGMPPADGQPRRQRGQSIDADRVDEASWRIVAIRLMVAHPTETAGKTQFSTPILQ